MHQTPPALHPPDPRWCFHTLKPERAAALHRACFPLESAAWVKALVRRADVLYQQGRGLGLTAHTGTEPTLLGFGLLTLWPRYAELSDLIVVPSMRGQGLGTALIQTLVQHPLAKHMSVAELSVSVHNLRALALYQRLGFQERKRVQWHTANQSDTFIYLRLSLR